MLVGIIIGLFIAWTLTTIALLVSSTQSDVPDIVGTGVIGLSFILIGRAVYKIRIIIGKQRYFKILLWTNGKKNCDGCKYVLRKHLKKFNTDNSKEHYITIFPATWRSLPDKSDYLYNKRSGWTKEGIEKYYRKDDED